MSGQHEMIGMLSPKWVIYNTSLPQGSGVYAEVGRIEGRFYKPAVLVHDFRETVLSRHRMAGRNSEIVTACTKLKPGKNQAWRKEVDMKLHPLIEELLA